MAEGSLAHARNAALPLPTTCPGAPITTATENSKRGVKAGRRGGSSGGGSSAGAAPAVVSAWAEAAECTGITALCCTACHDTPLYFAQFSDVSATGDGVADRGDDAAGGRTRRASGSTGRQRSVASDPSALSTAGGRSERGAPPASTPASAALLASVDDRGAAVRFAHAVAAAATERRVYLVDAARLARWRGLPIAPPAPPAVTGEAFMLDDASTFVTPAAANAPAGGTPSSHALSIPIVVHAFAGAAGRLPCAPTAMHAADLMAPIAAAVASSVAVKQHMLPLPWRAVSDPAVTISAFNAPAAAARGGHLWTATAAGGDVSGKRPSRPASATVVAAAPTAASGMAGDAAAATFLTPPPLGHSSGGVVPNAVGAGGAAGVAVLSVPSHAPTSAISSASTPFTVGSSVSEHVEAVRRQTSGGGGSGGALAAAQHLSFSRVEAPSPHSAPPGVGVGHGPMAARGGGVGGGGRLVSQGSWATAQSSPGVMPISAAAARGPTSWLRHPSSLAAAGAALPSQTPHSAPFIGVMSGRDYRNRDEWAARYRRAPVQPLGAPHDARGGGGGGGGGAFLDLAVELSDGGPAHAAPAPAPAAAGPAGHRPPSARSSRSQSRRSRSRAGTGGGSSRGASAFLPASAPVATAAGGDAEFSTADYYGSLPPAPATSRPTNEDVILASGGSVEAASMRLARLTGGAQAAYQYGLASPAPSVTGPRVLPRYAPVHVVGGDAWSNASPSASDMVTAVSSQPGGNAAGGGGVMMERSRYLAAGLIRYADAGGAVTSIAAPTVTSMAPAAVVAYAPVPSAGRMASTSASTSGGGAIVVNLPSAPSTSPPPSSSAFVTARPTRRSKPTDGRAGVGRPSSATSDYLSAASTSPPPTASASGRMSQHSTVLPVRAGLGAVGAVAATVTDADPSDAASVSSLPPAAALTLLPVGTSAGSNPVAAPPAASAGRLESPGDTGGAPHGAGGVAAHGPGSELSGAAAADDVTIADATLATRGGAAHGRRGVVANGKSGGGSGGARKPAAGKGPSAAGTSRSPLLDGAVGGHIVANGATHTNGGAHSAALGDGASLASGTTVTVAVGGM